MKVILNRLFDQQHLSRLEAKNMLNDIANSKFNDAEISSFLTIFNMRSITVDELSGFRDCMLERCISIDLSEYDAIDLCGTGGDGKNTFNISTLASFVVAGAGYKVAKHGNYGVSSVSGSSNVLEMLGCTFSNEESLIKKQIEKSGITYLHAPLFHPAMKNVAPIRKKLGVRTFFNMLGPMVNPSRPKKQLAGVFSLQLQRYYKYIYQQENTEYRIVHSIDGFDEISLTSKAKVISPRKEWLLKPSHFIQNKLKQEQLYGGKTLQEAADIFLQIISGKGNDAQNNAVCANAALAIQCYHDNKEVAECFEIAKESLLSGKAHDSLQKLINL